MKRQDKQAEVHLIDQLIATGSYDFNSGRRHREKQLEIVQLMAPQGQPILDAGCGPGTYGIILAQQGNRVVGIDISVKAAETARDRANKSAEGFLPMVGDLEKLPFKDNSFGICFCGFTLHHFPDISSIVAEFARVTKPDGKVTLLEPNGSNPAVRLSNIIENLWRGWLSKLGIDSANEVIHKHSVYTKALQQQGFVNIKVDSCYTGGLPPLPIKSQKGGLSFFNFLLIHILARLRHLFYIVMVKALPRPLNGIDLAITAQKGTSR